MKTIPLTKGFVALVSNIDYTFLMQWKWFYSTKGYSASNSPMVGGNDKGQ